VVLRGAVTRPGSYDLGESLKLKELINKADGLLGDAYLERVDVVRIKPDFTEELIKLDLGQALAGNMDHNIQLRGLDRVRVYGMTEMVPRTYVSITGQAKRPGRFLLQENMTLYDLIFKAGGYVDEEYKKLTYLKRAELVRVSRESDEKEIIPFNLGLVLDKQGIANTALRTDDAIRIYSVNEIEGGIRYVSISGQVKNPGEYELYENNMRIQDLLFKAGGFNDPLFKSRIFLNRADLIRIDNNRITQSIIPFNLDDVISDKNNEQNIILLAGDEIRVYSETVFNTVESVSINGVVRSPGTYSIKTGMTLKDLILEAGGLNDNVYRYRVEVARIDPLNKNLDEYAEVITFNMDEKFSVSFVSLDEGTKKEFSAASGFFQLNPYDLVSIRPDPYFSNQRKVTISGEVLYPGQYIILNSNEKITDIINRSGGLLPNAYPEASQYTRKGIKINASLGSILKNPKSRLNFDVQDGDEIIIVPHPNVIMITGEVNTSGIHKYVPGKRLRYYLKLSGGLRPDADKSNIWVAYPNGDSKKYNHFSLFSPKVIDGSSIVVGKEKEEEPFDRTEFAKEVTAILANLAQTVAVVALAYR
jgi:protein involved in polysaccharide export with SLBB domain